MWLIDRRLAGAKCGMVSARIAQADLSVACDLENTRLSVVLRARRARRFVGKSIARSAAMIHHHSDDSAPQTVPPASRHIFGDGRYVAGHVRTKLAAPRCPRCAKLFGQKR
jgi:hypothetical protein